MKASTRFAGLTLAKKDRATLAAMQRKGKLSARTWRRIRVLELLDQGQSVRETAKAAGTYPREVSRVGKRYVARGLQAALTDEPRGKPAPRLDSVQRAAVVAMVCGPAPEGRARWTIRLVTEHAVRRGIVPKVGRETIRVVLATHDLKPWREKKVVRAASRSRVHHADGRRAASLRAAP
ncbi:MAG: helix-turn-helix domain-containing protein [Kofleriaceae bacterium]|nr:helix-turn-helix domain-containing protein [Kofleriaceae bacterium]